MASLLAVVGMDARPLAQSAARAGWDVVAVDAFGFLDLGPFVTRSLSLDRDLGGLFPIDPKNWHVRLVQAVRRQAVSALAYVGGFENLPDLVAEMSTGIELLGNSPASLRAVRDPAQLREIALMIGMNTPQVLPAGTRPDPQLRWLRKRRRSGGGHGIVPWQSVVPDDPEFLVQQWVEGVPSSVSFVANGSSAQVVAVTHQLSGDPAFGAFGFEYAGNLLIPQPELNVVRTPEPIGNGPDAGVWPGRSERD